MKMVGYVGRREDTREIVETRLFPKGSTPRVLGATHDIPSVPVRGAYLFEIDLGEGIPPNSPVWDELVRIATAKALVTIVAAGLTPQQKAELRKHAQNFTVLEDFTLLPD